MAFAINTTNGLFSTRQGLALGGTTYQLELRYYQRTKGWVLSLFDTEGLPIITGCRIQPNQLLLSRFSLDNLTGDFVCFKNTVADAVLGRDNMGIGRDFTLTYVTQQELDG